ncbi:MAG TPA: response regulator [Chthoniobacteraceae bacterium]|nr:response regulator [Chthoniobacteraceae bacterium]
MTAPLKALIIDDEIQLRRLLRLALEGRGYAVVEADNGTRGLAAAVVHQPEIILLDLGLPDLDGVEVLKRLREWSDTPVLVLSVRDQEAIKVEALENGADDYVTKPFSTAELLARLSVIQRRRRTNEEPVLQLGAVTIDLANREVALKGKPIHLTPIEYHLLRLLARHAGRVLTQKQILTSIWGPGAADQAQYLRVYITHLRRKMEGSGVEIRNEPRIGYRLVGPAGNL